MSEIIRSRDFGGERYKYDFRLCTYEKGWAQVDTKQDASYYGTWTSPQRREIVCYCEGDLTLTRCTDDADYVSEIRKMADWNKQAGYWMGIDPGLGGQLQAHFAALGLGDLLH